MELSEKTGVLKIYTGETDKVHGRPLFEEIVFRARNEGLAGTTVYKGIMSYGASHSIHTMKIFALSGDLPVIIEIVDNIDKLDEFVPVVQELMNLSKKGGMITLQEVDVLRYKVGEKYRIVQK